MQGRTAQIAAPPRHFNEPNLLVSLASIQLRALVTNNTECCDAGHRHPLCRARGYRCEFM